MSTHGMDGHLQTDTTVEETILFLSIIREPVGLRSREVSVGVRRLPTRVRVNQV